MLMAACYFILCSNVFAQGKITGKVTDKRFKGIDADVKLLKASDSSFVKGAKCDTNGVFSIEQIAYGEYRLEVSYIEYSKLTLNNISISESRLSHTFDTLKLVKQDITTEEINVESEKGLIQFSADKKIFNVEDIQIDVPKRVEEANPVREGVVSFFNTSKGFGFINDRETGERVFVHINNLAGPIKETDKVSFEVEIGERGPSAVNVKKI